MSDQPTGPRMVLGVQPVRELLTRHGDAVGPLLLSRGTSPRIAALERFAAARGVVAQRVERRELDAATRGAMHQGAVAWGPELALGSIDEVLERPDLLAIALDGVVDPQNFGAVIRSSVGLCEGPIIWSESGSAPLTPATFRASAGAIEHATLCRVRSLHGTLAQAVSLGVSVIGLAPQAEMRLDEVDLTGPTIIVIGSEEKGMTKAVRRTCTAMTKLAGSKQIQSLNASVAAGIALHTAMISRLTTRA